MTFVLGELDDPEYRVDVNVFLVKLIGVIDFLAIDADGVGVEALVFHLILDKVQVVSPSSLERIGSEVRAWRMHVLFN